jgi:hypothetical protein
MTHNQQPTMYQKFMETSNGQLWVKWMIRCGIEVRKMELAETGKQAEVLKPAIDKAQNNEIKYRQRLFVSCGISDDTWKFIYKMWAKYIDTNPNHN